MNSIVFDIDGTICPIKDKSEKYEDIVPNQDIINKIKELRDNGFKIVLFTSRNMRTYEGNIALILKNTKPILEQWLSKWDIPYDELVFGKPWPGPDGFYVDDRTIRPNELLKLSIDKLNERMLHDRIGRK